MSSSLPSSPSLLPLQLQVLGSSLLTTYGDRKILKKRQIMRVVLSGKRLELRPLTAKDAQNLFEAIDSSRKELARWVPWIRKVKGPDDQRRFILTSEEAMRKKSSITLGIFHHQTKKVFGVIGTGRLNFLDQKTEIGYWMRTNESGKGYTTEACTLLIQYLFEKMNFHRITLNAATTNRASQRVAKKLGFRREGLLRENQLLGNRWIDYYTYGLLQQEYNRLKKSQYQKFLQ